MGCTPQGWRSCTPLPPFLAVRLRGGRRGTGGHEHVRRPVAGSLDRPPDPPRHRSGERRAGCRRAGGRRRPRRRPGPGGRVVTSLWLDRAAPVADDPLPDSGVALDAIVVGAGLTGLTTALLLARSGMRVECVEARQVGAVTTGRTTGKVSLLQGTHLSRIRRHQSDDVAAAYVDANREGMEWLLRFCDDHAVPYQRRTAVTYAADEQERSSVEKEHEAASALGLAVEWRDTLDVPFPHVAATTLADQAQLDSMDVLAALAEQLRSHGGTLHQGHRVRSVSKGGRPTVRLEGGEALTADHLVLATGTPILDRGLHFARLEPQRSYVLALDGAGPMEGMYLSAGSDARSVRDAPGGTLVVGGAYRLPPRTPRGAAGVDGEVVPRHERDPPLVGPGLQQPRRGAVRRTAAARRRPDPRRHRLREVGHDQRGRGRPRHLLRHPRRPADVGAGAQQPHAVGVQRRRDRPDQPRGRRRDRHRCRADRPRAAARQRRTRPGQPVRRHRRLHPPRRAAEVERRRGDVG
ncbi:MAG: FAD-binding oxidoreductase, partial [Terrabacter sp.]|nr:FAD-binding oxidoreductase [Terrabacter sp.]